MYSGESKDYCLGCVVSWCINVGIILCLRYKYSYMEEMVGAIEQARQVSEILQNFSFCC